jgi:(R)-citramalate synthase
MLNIIEQIKINIPGDKNNPKETPEQEKTNFYGNEYRAVAG